MDTDLFQGVLLGLLAVGLVVLIALLATLGGIRKALEQRSSEPRAGSGSDTTPSSSIASTGTDPGIVEAPVETGPPSTESPAAETSAATPAGSARAGSGATPPAEKETPAASESGNRADSIRSVLQEHGVGATRTSDEGSPATAEEPVVDSAFAAHADDPQEEPFQRDGRWWFRRGEELLCYDEATGQWKPAPATDTPQQETPAAVRTVPVQETPTAAEATGQTETMPVADQVSTFWKCPTCGAVNGSTAATCRMCFAARP